MAASSSVVIKVKHGDTLRRFNAQIVGDEFNVNMDGLRKKIISLFSFDSDTELMLTYIDEDDEVVTLADDDDLRDVVKQALNPLRITVKLNAEKNAPDTRPSGSSIPLILPHVGGPSQNPNTGIPEILKSLPGPLYGTLAKISADLASKASSSGCVQQPVTNTGVSQVLKAVAEPLHESLSKVSADLASIAKTTADIMSKASSPAMAELVVDHFSKLGLSYLDQLSQSEPGAFSFSTESGIPESSVAGKETRHSDVRSEQSSRNNENLEIIKPEAIVENNEVKTHTVSGGAMDKSSENIVVDNAVVTRPGNGSLPNSGPIYSQSAVTTSHRSGKRELLVKKKVVMNKMNGKSRLENRTVPVENNAGKRVGSSIPSSSTSGAATEFNNPIGTSFGPKPVSVGASDPTKVNSVGTGMNSELSDSFGNNPGSYWATGSGSLNFSGSYSGYGPAYDCPFSGLATRSAASPLPASDVGPFRRSISQNDCSGSIFHRGVRCDGCGVHPITGPRFKSKVLVNYDLCSICFGKLGNDDDYIRMDRPAVYRHPMDFKGQHDARARSQSQLSQQVHRNSNVKPVAPKLDSRFIQDVNIFDGTVMAPLTPFTKIWRMRNNGTIAWPQKTQLVWIGGDKLNNELSVEVQIPATGLLMDEELEVAVDFISPELPGRYISYWRMALPSGQKFGQRVWVLIQVDASLKETPRENIRNLNLNLPPVSSGPEIINVDPEPVVEGGPSKAGESKKMEDLVQPNEEQELKFPINDSLLVGTSSSRPVSYPVVELSGVAPGVPPVPRTMLDPLQQQNPFAYAGSVVGAQRTENELLGKVEVEEQLLKELEEMGFKEVDLNKKMLRMNEYDLEQAVNDLCGVAEWDPILEELQEMGFRDKETNKMLLKKNNGSIKRVVMDLIAGEKIE